MARDITNDAENPSVTTLQTTDRFPFVQDGTPDALKEIAFSALLTEIAAGVGLTYNAATITTSNLSCAEGNVYGCTIAGLTANRNAVLTAPSAAGKQIRIVILDGDADYAVPIIGDTGVTINGGSAATEWSRLFIANESVTLESTSTSNWNVIRDGRIPCQVVLSREAAQSVNSGAFTRIDVDTAAISTGMTVDLATNYNAVVRRAGNYEVSAMTASEGIDDQEFVDCLPYKNGSAIISGTTWVSYASTNVVQKTPSPVRSFPLVVNDSMQLYTRHNEGAAQNTPTGASAPFLYLKEVLS